MRNLIRLLIGTLTTGMGALAAVAAQGADLPTYFSPLASYDPVVLKDPAPPSGFNWDSYFVGASGSIVMTDPLAFSAEAFVGVTATADQFLYGGVLSAGLLSGDDGGATVELTSRLGVLISEEVAAFAILGGGYESDFDRAFGVIGGGISVAVAESMTVDATLKARRFNGTPEDSEWRLAAGLGIAFHF